MNYKIDKSVLEAEERETLEALLLKAKVNPEAAQEEMKGDEPEVPSKKKPTQKAEVEDMETKKSATTEQLAAVQEELAAFKKSMEMQQFATIAKKYAPLGKKEDELAETLYNMKKSDEASYNAFVGVLDEHLALVEKSGLFGEIGKSASGSATSGGVEAKVEAKAAEIMKADPNVTYDAAIAKAWEESPELMAEYDAEYLK